MVATFKFDMDYINNISGCSFEEEAHKTRCRKIIKMFKAVYLDFLTTVNLAYGKNKML